jgi:hypothetical protein
MTQAEKLHKLWKKTSPGMWTAHQHGSRPDWVLEGPDISVPYMPQGDAEFIAQAHKAAPLIFEEMKRLNEDSQQLDLYKRVLGSQLGHLVGLLDTARKWRARECSVDDLMNAIDEALDEEARRAGYGG